MGSQPMKREKNNASNDNVCFLLHTTLQVVCGVVLPVENARFSQTAPRCASVRLNVKRDTNQCVGQTDTCISTTASCTGPLALLARKSESTGV